MLCRSSCSSNNGCSSCIVYYCALFRVVYIFGGRVKDPVNDLTPTFLTDRICSVVVVVVVVVVLLVVVVIFTIMLCSEWCIYLVDVLKTL